MQKTRPRKKELISGSVVIVAIFCVMIIVGECVLRFLGTYETYGERNGFGYASMYAEPKISWFRNHRPGHHKTVKPEYTEKFYINEQGFRDRDWPLRKREDEIRIVTLGSSMVEGLGSLHQPSSYPGALNKILDKRFGNRASILVMNGGISNSDPVYNLQSLKRLFVGYKPDIILQSVNAVDWQSDIPIRGGLDRFQKDGTVDLQGPWYEPLYEYSHLFRGMTRMVFGWRQDLMSRSEREKKRDEAIGIVCDVFKEETLFAKSIDTDIVFIIQSTAHDLDPDNKNTYKRRMSIVECAKRYASVTFDLGQELSRRFSPQQVEKLYWPIDRHFRPAGYEAYAKIVAEAIEPLVVSRIERKGRAERSENLVPMTSGTKDLARQTKPNQ